MGEYDLFVLKSIALTACPQAKILEACQLMWKRRQEHTSTVVISICITSYLEIYGHSLVVISPCFRLQLAKRWMVCAKACMCAIYEWLPMLPGISSCTKWLYGAHIISTLPSSFNVPRGSSKWTQNRGCQLDLS